MTLAIARMSHTTIVDCVVFQIKRDLKILPHDLVDDGHQRSSGIASLFIQSYEMVKVLSQDRFRKRPSFDEMYTAPKRCEKSGQAHRGSGVFNAPWFPRLHESHGAVLRVDQESQIVVVANLFKHDGHVVKGELPK